MALPSRWHTGPGSRESTQSGYRGQAASIDDLQPEPACSAGTKRQILSTRGTGCAPIEGDISRRALTLHVRLAGAASRTNRRDRTVELPLSKALARWKPSAGPRDTPPAIVRNSAYLCQHQT